MQDLVEAARRNGPLPYSALGRDPARRELRGREAEREGGVEWLTASVDRWWDTLGRPDPYLVAEVGSDGGSRVKGVVERAPRCAAALRYVLVDDPPVLDVPGLLLESPALALGPVRPEEGDESATPVPGVGPLVTALAEVPQVEGVGVVLSVGWLSGEPADRYERTQDGWAEVRLAATAGGRLADMLVPAEDDVSEGLDKLTAGRVRNGDRVTVADRARAWLVRALASLAAGRVVVVDAFVSVTGPLGDGPPPLPLDQLVSVRRPVHGPVDAFAHLQAVEWEARR